MSRIKATLRFLHARRHPDQIAREVEAELRFHIDMRTRANVEGGMKPNEAQLAARQSFGDFHRFKTECCEISRDPPFDRMPLKIGLHIALATFAGAWALWAVNVPHDSLVGLFRQLVAITILTCLFVFVRRARSRRGLAGDRTTLTAEGVRRRKDESFLGDVREVGNVNIAAHDDRGRTPVERMFDSE